MEQAEALVKRLKERLSEDATIKQVWLSEPSNYKWMYKTPLHTEDKDGNITGLRTPKGLFYEVTLPLRVPSNPERCTPSCSNRLVLIDHLISAGGTKGQLSLKYNVECEQHGLIHKPPLGVTFD